LGILGHDNQAVLVKPRLDVSRGAWLRLKGGHPIGDALVVDVSDRRCILPRRWSRTYPHRCIPSIASAASRLNPARAVMNRVNVPITTQP
jgi:hypothetical protein